MLVLHCVHRHLSELLSISLLMTLFALSCADHLPVDDLCVPLNRSVLLPVRIRLIFAGAVPLFMRDPSWNSLGKRTFLTQLSGIVRYRSLPYEADDSPIAVHLNRAHPDLCSVVEYGHRYEVVVAPKETAAKIDTVLSAALEKATSMYTDGTQVADQFRDILRATWEGYRESNASREYNFLIYTAGSLAPQRGYQAEPGAPIGTVGIASNARFAFLDVDAKPFFLDNSGSTTAGESLMVSSKSSEMYAAQMRSIASGIFAPRTSPNMRRFPHENRILFTLHLVDVSAVLGRMSGYGGDSLGNKTVGSTFDAPAFEQLVRSAFNADRSVQKEVSVSLSTIDMQEDAVMAMAVARAFSMRGLEMVLDSERLLRDLLASSPEKAGYFVDSSFVAHVPLYLFSFADDSRITHFDSVEELRAKVVQKESVFMVENRLHDEVSGRTSTLSEAAKEVLELLGGLTRKSLGHMNAREGVIPLILRDIIDRNIAIQELDWSESYAARKAVELLNFEGLDSRLIPHEEGSAIEEARHELRQSLLSLYSAWDKFSVSDVGRAMEDLVEKSKSVAEKLHDEICNQPLSEEIMLKAEAEVEVIRQANERRSKGYYMKWTLLPIIIGVLCGVIISLREKRKQRGRATGLGEIPIVSSRHHFEAPASGLWFSTLTASDKPKIN